MKTAWPIALAAYLATGCLLEESPESEGLLYSDQESAATSGESDPSRTETSEEFGEDCGDDPESCIGIESINDNFQISTTDGCGRTDFVDFGPGAPGGGDNDDYIVIHDFCADGHGVRAAAKVVDSNGVVFDLGTMYNGNGLAGDPVVWDPFKAIGNVIAGDKVTIQACLVDGASDPTPFNCRSTSHTSADG